MERQNWVDSAKAIGIFLVFYGHFVERVCFSGSSVGYEQFKFIYSFHMPFFFFITGFFGKPSANIKASIRKIFLRRIIPVITFSVMLIPVWILWMHFRNELNFKLIFGMGFDYIRGFPSFAVVTWFLICLFVCEIYAMMIFRRVRSHFKILLIALATLLGGLLLCQKAYYANGFMRFALDMWYVFGGLVALGFYLLGYLAYPYLHLLVQYGKKFIWLVLGGIGLLILVYSYGLNLPTEEFIVYMIHSIHGEVFPFLLSAFAGIVIMICLSSIIPSSRLIRFIGQNTLILLGLNNVFHHFVNQEIVTAFMPENHWLYITAYCFAITAISILICVPCIMLFNKWIPQLMGKSNTEGPLLPDLEKMKFDAYFKKLFRR